MQDSEIGGLDSEISDVPLRLTSRDGHRLNISRRAAYMSNFVKTAAEQDESTDEISIDRVKGKILQFIVEYLEHHNGVVPPEIKKPLKSLDMKKVLADEWDADFISQWDSDYPTLFDVILGANYMDINPLLHLGCAKVASKIKGKSHDEIKRMFLDGGVQIPDKKDEENPADI